jgi:hypothetical protein
VQTISVNGSTRFKTKGASVYRDILISTNTFFHKTFRSITTADGAFM